MAGTDGGAEIGGLAYVSRDSGMVEEDTPFTFWGGGGTGESFHGGNGGVVSGTIPAGTSWAFEWDGAAGSVMTFSKIVDEEPQVYQLFAFNGATGDEEAAAGGSFVIDEPPSWWSEVGAPIGETGADGGGSPPVQFHYAYDAASRMTSSDATLGGALDYVNSYAYDALARLTTLTQTDQGGNAVSPKRVDFAYNALGQFSQIDRYAGTTTANPVVTTAYGYDQDNRLTSIEHTGTALGSTFEQTFGYGYDRASRVSHFSSVIDGADATYDYDRTGQLTAVDHDDSLDDEAYHYDSNGNRTSDITNQTGTFSYDTAAFNRLTSDGQYTYEYDNEGNRTRRTEISGGWYTLYTWDNRNRLVAVTDYNDSDQELSRVEYKYDVFNQLIGRKVFNWGSSTPIESNVFVYENGQVVLQFGEVESGDTMDWSNLTHRYLWGPAVDMLMADEKIDWSDNDADGEVFWALTDRQGSVTDMMDNNGTLRRHAAFDSFGELQSEHIEYYDAAGDIIVGTQPWNSPEAANSMFLYTGRFYDRETRLQYNTNRWYDPKTGRWMSEDPIEADVNSYRYVGNSPTSWVDPNGLQNWVPPRGWPARQYPEVPRTDSTGRIHDPIPEEVPGGWCEENVKEALEEVRKSIENRRQNVPVGKGMNRAHDRPLKEEKDWEKKLKKRLDDLKNRPRPKVDPAPIVVVGEGVTGVTIIWIIISEGSRIVFPPRNLVPVP